MRLFILPPSFQGEEVVRLEGKEYHYLIRVLRKQVGDSFNASDGEGTLYYATVEEITSLLPAHFGYSGGGPWNAPFPRSPYSSASPRGRSWIS
jgi:hypothetical protein